VHGDTAVENVAVGVIPCGRSSMIVAPSEVEGPSLVIVTEKVTESPGLAVVGETLFERRRSATGATVTGVVSWLLAGMRSTLDVKTSALISFLFSSAASDALTLIFVDAFSPLVIEPSWQVTVEPESLQPDGTLTTESCDGIVITIPESAAVDGPLFTVEKRKSASSPASISLGPLAFTARSTDGVITTSTEAWLVEGSGSSVSDVTTPRFVD
jgi:hypothetical protein